jgi:2-amino-4-hydroxy-6-hydroxymethyldihydropteridine diphosphokinase / dihydropteroate synthase
VRFTEPLAKIVGILNLTPDSFSDGGRFNNIDAAVEQTSRMIFEGAGVIDVGAESTRPGAALISAEDEWRRLEPFLKALSEQVPELGRETVLSIDTRHGAVAEKSFKYKVGWINDVSGFEDSHMTDVLKSSPCRAVLMHHLGVPPTKDRVVPGLTALPDVLSWGHRKIAQLEEAGISRDKIILDPGVGFGKTPPQTFELIGQSWRLKEWGTEVLFGHSRKSFMNLVSNVPACDRDAMSAQLSAQLATRGVDYVRVHDVAMTMTALRLASQVRGAIP